MPYIDLGATSIHPSVARFFLFCGTKIIRARRPQDTDDDEGGDSDEAPELLEPSAVGGSALQPSARDTRVTDITPYKKYANDIISNVIGQWLAHSPHLGGHVFIQFTLMQSDHMEPVLGGYRDPRACGGLSAKISQMPALASG